MSSYPGMFNYHANQPVEKMGGMTVYHPVPIEEPVEETVKETVPPQPRVIQPFMPEPHIMAYGWWCPTCDSFHEETGECPYE